MTELARLREENEELRDAIRSAINDLVNNYHVDRAWKTLNAVLEKK